MKIEGSVAPNTKADGAGGRASTQEKLRRADVKVHLGGWRLASAHEKATLRPSEIANPSIEKPKHLIPRFLTGMPYVFGLLTALALLGCQTSATAPANRHVARSDLEFVTGLTNLVAFNRAVIGDELQRSSDPRVKEIALYLKSDVETFSARVQTVAARDGISPPVDMRLFTRSDMHSRIATLMATSHYDFDKEFVSDELVGNQQILSQAEQTIQEPSGDPELRALLSEAVSRLRTNVTRLQTLQAQLWG